MQHQLPPETGVCTCSLTGSGLGVMGERKGWKQKRSWIKSRCKQGQDWP